ncbi:MAG: NAD(P)H-dependent oxidoreductase subunit E, partial [Acidobacteriota bacterium]
TALLPALHLCQEALHHVPAEYQDFIAGKTGLAPSHVYGVVSFYEMFTEKQLGKYVIEVCKTLPCMLRGSEALLEHLERKLGVKAGQTTTDKRFTLMTVECLACCDGGPSMRVNHALYKDVSPSKADEILAGLE